ncbi:mRNA export factor GLE1-like [Saccostrea echinata]|uniref:mRNA export factor GLE1-like n=1 Tax=Saccostrea echinata TaxID=191078 RepID=UPI002A80D3C6|nr:mRNA export factor GLE1-like [Saccostrea echinata]
MKSIVSQLKASPKGQLKYERDPNIEKEYFDKYLSPPKLSTHHSEVSTQNSFYVHEDEEELSESEMSESFRNLKVQIQNKVKKPNKAKVQFTTENHHPVSDMTIQVSNKRADPMYGDTNRNAGKIKISFRNDLCKDNHKKKGRLTEKPLDLPCVDKAASEKILVSPEYNKSRRGIQDYEEERIKESKTEFERKRRQFKEAGRKINRRAERQINEYENRRQEKAVSQRKQMDQLEKQGSAELLEKQMKMIQGYIHHAKMVEKKQERIQEEMKKKEAERLKTLEKVKSIVSDSKTILDKVKTMYNSYAAKLPESVAKGIHSAQQRYNMSQQIVSPEDSKPEITNQQLITISENFRFLSNTHDFVKQSIQEVKEKEKKEALEAKMKAEEEARKKAEEEASKRAEAASSVASPGQPLISSTPIPGATSTVTQETQGATGGVSVASTTAAPTPVTQIRPAEGEVLCVDMEAFQEYTRLQQMLKDAEAAIQVLSSTPQLKKMKFDLQKAVNIPVNAISAVSGAHLRDKLQRLLVLLSGQQVEITNKRVSVRDHPAALPFCKYLIAKMVVRKGEEQVSSIFESAFPLAAVTVGLLAQHPDIRDLLLAHFHSLCPYTVPYHIPRQDQQSTEEYHKALGYKYDSDGNVEKQDKFLKRMSGIMRLYTSVMVSSPPRQQSNHPFGVEHAWIWLSRVMNIQPLPDITATMVFDLLEVTGHALFHKYKKQFLKMLHILIREFLPKLKSVASSGGGGPVSRLEALIKASIQRQGQIPPPEGLLPPNFWSS